MRSEGIHTPGSLVADVVFVGGKEPDAFSSRGVEGQEERRRCLRRERKARMVHIQRARKRGAYMASLK
jgi:hypothetical protein